MCLQAAQLPLNHAVCSEMIFPYSENIDKTFSKRQTLCDKVVHGDFKAP